MALKEVSIATNISEVIMETSSMTRMRHVDGTFFNNAAFFVWVKFTSATLLRPFTSSFMQPWTVLVPDGSWVAATPVVAVYTSRVSSAGM
jgi:hypothetical protein